MGNQLIAAHGGRLVNRFVSGQEQEELLKRLPTLPRIVLNERQVADLELIATGALSPLEGFMEEQDYRSVVREMRLARGLPWTIPVTLAVSSEQAKGLKVGQQVALAIERNHPLAALTVRELYPYQKEEEAREVYRTTDERHPGVQAIYAQGEVLVGGQVSVVEPIPHDDFLPYRLSPAETRRIFAEQGWRRVVGFQTRNPIHRAHEYLQKCALEIVDGLLIHPLVGSTKSDDVPARVRMRCYEVLIEQYYPKERVLLAVFPAAMRYAGPREAIFHAIVRKNYGCTHFIVGRDHAGVGDYYGPFDAHKIFDEFLPEELGITPLFFDQAFYCRRCEEMVSPKTCPHPDSNHVSLSGTQVREMLRSGVLPPEEYTRPEVARILIEAMREKEHKSTRAQERKGCARR